MEGIFTAYEKRLAQLEETKQEAEDKKQTLENLIAHVGSLEKASQDQLRSTSSAARKRRIHDEMKLLDLDIDQQIQDLHADIEEKRKEIEALERDQIELERDVKGLEELLRESK